MAMIGSRYLFHLKAVWRKEGGEVKAVRAVRPRKAVSPYSGKRRQTARHDHPEATLADARTLHPYGCKEI